MDITELNQQVSDSPNFIDIRETNRKFNLIKNIDKTNELVFKVRSEND